MLPFLLSPYYKKVIWGGSFLAKFKNAPSHLDHIGESWEVSAMPGHESVVASGPMTGRTLFEVCRTRGAELMGREVYERFDGRFPLLVKFIDAADRLSIQVHPGAANSLAPDAVNAKSEMWYILETMPQSKIILGFKNRIEPEVFSRHMAEGTTEQLLRVFDSCPGDVFFIPSGQVHGICAGNFLVEIQQAADTTYRIHDYDRLGPNGCRRELHHERAMESIDFENLAPEKTHPTDALLHRSEFFRVDRCRMTDSDRVTIHNPSFTAVVCTDGFVELNTRGDVIRVPRGHTALVPADTPSVLTGRGEALLIVP
ncbi:MAG: class I mannose-6-phosphate isomerase [Muribaculaceae bacterium]|nr:class I mannose-6-phosphate isomerase [Muribaculaceae bacterium]